AQDGEQRKSPDKNGQLETITVTATKRGESIEKVPMAITAISGSKLEDLGAVNFEDFARTVPGLDFAALGAGQNRATIRGVSTFSGVSVIGIYLDDSPVASPINYTQPSLALYDIDRIEVLRGPQGTLYGEGSLGGTIRYITRPAELDATEASFATSLSSTEHGGLNYSVAGMFNAPVVNDRLAVRGEVQHIQDAGFIKNVPLNDDGYNDSHTDAARLKTTLKLSDDFSVRASFMYQNIVQGAPNVESYDAPRGSLLNYDTAQQSYRDRFYQSNVTAEYRFDWADVQSSTSYFDRRTDADQQSRGLQLNLGAYPYPLYSVTENKYNVFTEELRAASRGDGPFKWVGGVYYKNQNVIQHENDFNTVPSGPFVGNRYQKQSFEQVAVFGEASYAITPALTATLGLRWFDENQKAIDELGRNFTVSASKVVPKGVLQYNFADDRMIYASVTEGFRSGGVNFYKVPGVDTTYKPDTTLNYEVGTKLAFFDRHLTVNLAAYYIDWRDLQTFVYRPDIGPSAFFVENVSAARSKGFEWEIAWAPEAVAGLTLGFNGNVTDARFTKDAPFEGKAGNRLPQVPANNSSAFAQYEFPIADSKAGFVRVDYQRVGTFYNSGSNTLSSGGYDLVNLRAGVDLSERWRVNVFVNNAGNTVADLYKYYSTYYGTFRNPPRTIGVESRWTL
ncbi:MAG: TonB-dependent receptor, partial [Rudaea sp.]|nr:TonB-dependent receptor [Rudaea sp.]